MNVSERDLSKRKDEVERLGRPDMFAYGHKEVTPFL